MNEQQADLLAEAERLIDALEAHPDPSVGDQVRELLGAIDLVHRTALTHLVNGIQGMAGDAFLNRLTSDPAVRLLLMSYDLLAVDRRLITEEALDAVRGHLHARGIDVELSEVVGGVVYVRLHGLSESGIGAQAVRADLEAALREGLLGFQELVLGEREQAGRQPLVQLGGVRPANRPVYRTAFREDELHEGEMRAVEMDGEPVLVARVGGDLYALANRCGDSPLPLHFGSLEGAELRCSWHDCRYDIRSGKRLDVQGERIGVYPVAVHDGEIRVAVSVEPVLGS